MRGVLLFCMVFGFSAGVFAIDVEVEEVLDAPPSNFGGFYVSSATYAPNGDLLLNSTSAFNVFVRKEGQWIPLIDQYRTDEYNRIQEEEDRHRGYSDLYDSTIPGEFVYRAEWGAIPAEYYRIFENNDGEFEAEWVPQEYYDSHRLKYLSGGWGVGEGIVLKQGYRLELTPDTLNEMVDWLDIVDEDGELIYRITEDFNEGFVYDTFTLTTNPARDRVAMVVRFRPEKDSPYHHRSMVHVSKLVILKITYNEHSDGW